MGGGGARGCSHVGMIKATLEAGIPIDHVAGVSIGALVGGLFATERNLTEVTVKARAFSNKMGQIWRQVLDLTWPYASWFTGRAFNQLIQEQFGERDILDSWLPYFTITTDITCSSMRVHDYGSMWRYVRASMSLAGNIYAINSYEITISHERRSFLSSVARTMNLHYAIYQRCHCAVTHSMEKVQSLIFDFFITYIACLMVFLFHVRYFVVMKIVT